MITEDILKLLNSETFQGLKSYYDETTLFNVIGAERSENRHSAFLRWFLSTDSSHGLGDKPLRLFLRLLATPTWGRETFKEELYDNVLAGNYELELLEPVETEKYVGKIKANNRKLRGIAKAYKRNCARDDRPWCKHLARHMAPFERAIR